MLRDARWQRTAGFIAKPRLDEVAAVPRFESVCCVLSWFLLSFRCAVAEGLRCGMRAAGYEASRRGPLLLCAEGRVVQESVDVLRQTAKDADAQRKYLMDNPEEAERLAAADAAAVAAEAEDAASAAPEAHVVAGPVGGSARGAVAVVPPVEPGEVPEAAEAGEEGSPVGQEAVGASATGEKEADTHEGQAAAEEASPDASAANGDSYGAAEAVEAPPATDVAAGGSESQPATAKGAGEEGASSSEGSGAGVLRCACSAGVRGRAGVPRWRNVGGRIWARVHGRHALRY